MKKLLLLSLSWFFISNCFAQLSSPSVKIKDDLNTLDFSREGQLGKKAANSNKVCRGDTLDYARYKARNGLVGINTSKGYQLGQYFEAPGELTISGFDFYAWVTANTGDTVTLYCHLYNVGSDSLPTGSPVRSDTLWADTTFGAGVLTGIRKRAVWTPYKTKKPFVLVVESTDSLRTAVVSNSYQSRSGLGEYLGRGTIGNRWFNFRDLNISGTPLDCDMALEPYVQYNFFNDFEFDDCYNYRDTVKFRNTSSGFVKSRMYNRYELSNIGRFCHYWDFGDLYRNYFVDGERKYSNARNYEVKMYSSHYALRGGGICRDTTVKTIYFKPDELIMQGERKVCSGESPIVRGITNSIVFWYNKYQDTTHVYQGVRYSFGNLQEADTIYAQSINAQCSTQRKTFIVDVTKTPQIPVVVHDSICQNAKANLSAKSDVGIMRWFQDSTSSTSLLESEVLEIGPLNSDTSFYVKAYNGSCTHPGRVEVNAYVSADFAPDAPIVSNDTTICLLDGEIQVEATSKHKLRWYNEPSGGSVIDSTLKISIIPTSPGIQTVYVESFDGKCPSTRLPIKVEVHHFDELMGSNEHAICQGDTLFFDFSTMRGNLFWYPNQSSQVPEHTGLTYSELDLQHDTSYWVQPFQGVCMDTLKHQLSIEAIPFGSVKTFDFDTAVCAGIEPKIHLTPNEGKVYWFQNGQLLDSGNNFDLGPLNDPFFGSYQIDNRGCISDMADFQILPLLQPESGFDYQINAWRAVEFLSKLRRQGTYMWDFADNGDTAMGTDVNHRFSEDGKYNVRLIVVSDDGCRDTSFREIVINTVGITPHLPLNFKLYPNPACNKVYLSGMIDGHTHVQIRDLEGRTLWSGSPILTSNRKIGEIPLTEFASGFYLVNIEVAGKQIVKRLIIE